ncbi:MAG: U32 family peptidase [Bdellovibrio sp.]|nr:U32 family peptidase [Bdellovibrio sp.]
MKTSLSIYNQQALREYLALGKHEFDQVILHVKGLSRVGSISLEEVASQKNLPASTSLVWDILMPESEFQEKKQLFDMARTRFLHKLNWRVVDMGTIHYLINCSPPVNLEFDATTGFHNKIALTTLQEFVGSPLKKMILSLELPEAELRDIHADLKTPTEILVLGPIPLFYTPRHLLRRFDTDRALGKSEETPHNGFVIEDNIQGTFMWLPKELFLLDHLDEIADTGVEWVRFDCPLIWALEGAKVVRRFNEGQAAWKTEATLLKKKYERPTIKGFFKANRTNALFPKLKNQILRNKNCQWVADVIDLEKDRFMVVQLKREMKLGDTLAMHTPEGRVSPVQVRFLKNSLGHDISEAWPGDVAIIPHVRGACVGSLLGREV